MNRLGSVILKSVPGFLFCLSSGPSTMPGEWDSRGVRQVRRILSTQWYEFLNFGLTFTRLPKFWVWPLQRLLSFVLGKACVGKETQPSLSPSCLSSQGQELPGCLFATPAPQTTLLPTPYPLVANFHWLPQPSSLVFRVPIWFNIWRTSEDRREAVGKILSWFLLPLMEIIAPKHNHSHSQGSFWNLGW